VVQLVHKDQQVLLGALAFLVIQEQPVHLAQLVHQGTWDLVDHQGLQDQEGLMELQVAPVALEQLEQQDQLDLQELQDRQEVLVLLER